MHTELKQMNHSALWISQTDDTAFKHVIGLQFGRWSLIETACAVYSSRNASIYHAELKPDRDSSAEGSQEKEEDLRVWGVSAEISLV